MDLHSKCRKTSGFGNRNAFSNNFLSPLQINNGNLQYNPKEKEFKNLNYVYQTSI